MSTEPISQVCFNSWHSQRVDDQRRLQIPAKWRSQAEGFELTLIIWPSAAVNAKYLLALPPELREGLQAKLKAMPYYDPKVESLRRYLGTNSEQVKVDRLGRFVLPVHMVEAVGIKRDAVLVGSWDRFEIWSPENYTLARPVDESQAKEALSLI